MPTTVDTTLLDNGVVVISEKVPARRQVSLSLTLVRGSRHQDAGENGFAHLLEHMLFKGTRHRDGEAINRSSEALGGGINAFTDRELTVLHATVLEEDADEAFRLLAELVLEPRIDPSDLKMERRVVAQEAAMASEDIEDWVFERAIGSFWGKHPLAWPVLGRSSIIRRVSVRRLKDFHTSWLAGTPILVTAAGALEHGRLTAWVQEAFSGLPARQWPKAVPPSPHSGQEIHRNRNTRQAHLLWMAPAAPYGHQEHLVELLANTILGGGTASRLFRELRERRGLAYQLYSQVEALSDTGEWSLYAAVPAAQRREAEQTVAQVLETLGENGPVQEELQWARSSLRKQWLLGQEDLDTRMGRLTRQYLYLGQCTPEGEILAAMERVTAGLLRDAYARAWNRRMEWSCVPG